MVQIGHEVEGKGWRFKVSHIYKRKARYFYGNVYIAQGHFLVVISDATNLEPGTGYFARKIQPYMTDPPGNVYDDSWTGSSYAEWQYSRDGVYADVNPRLSIKLAIAYDLPDSLGDIMLSTAVPEWIYLGNFSQMPSGDS